MCRILFWNLKRKDLTDLVCDLVAATVADVVVLNETSLTIERTLAALRERVDSQFSIPAAMAHDKFQCLVRAPSLDLTEVHKGIRTSVRKLKFDRQDLLLALVHGVDIRNYDSDARLSAAQRLASEIQFVKTQQSHNRVIVLGDFNMNPYDPGMNLAAGFNAMMTRECVAAGQRTFLGEQFDFYYNPMWGLFGDGTRGPAGTVYDMSNRGPYGWSMLDQVIFSHSTIGLFGSVEILSHAGTRPLINSRGRPDSRVASDHLPILVQLRGVGRD